MTDLSKSKEFLIFGIVLFLILEFLLYGFYSSNPGLCKFTLQLSFIGIVIYSFYIFKKLTGSFFSIHTLFLGLFIYFLGSRVILDFFGYMNIHELDYYSVYTISFKTLCRTLLNLNIAVATYLIGAILFLVRHPNFSFKIATQDSVYSKNRLIDVLFVIGILFKVYFSVQLFMQLTSKGYLAYFLGDFEVQRNIVQWFFESFALIGLFVYFSRNKKLTLWIYLGAVFYAALSLATGQRGIGFLFLVFSSFYLIQLGKIKLTKTKILVFVSILYTVSVAFEIFRRGGENISGVGVLLEGIPNFFWRGSVSSSLLVYSIDYKEVLDYSFVDLFGNIKYLIDYYITKLSGGSPISNMMEANALRYKLFGPYLSYTVNPKMYGLGLALGGSYVAQLFALGNETAQIIGGLFVGYTISLFYSFLSSEKFFIRFLGFNFLLSFIYIPRDNLLDFLTEYWIVYIALFTYISLIKLSMWESFYKIIGLNTEKRRSINEDII